MYPPYPLLCSLTSVVSPSSILTRFTRRRRREGGYDRPRGKRRVMRVRGRSSLLSSLRSRLRHSTPGPFVFRLRSPSRSAASRLLPAARNERRRGSVGKETAWVTVRGEETWHRLTLDLWLAKDNRFLNPKSSYKRILMAPSCRFIFCTVSSHMIRSLYSLVPR